MSTHHTQGGQAQAGTPSTPRAPAVPAARFLTGSLFRHVLVMSGTSAIGLMAVFVVDLINLYYLSKLGQPAITAAIGFVGVVSFFHMSLSIGLTIGIAATVARAIGAGRRADAQRIGTTALVLMTGCMATVALLTALGLHPLLRLLGATGEVEQLAASFLHITLWSTPLVGVGMATSALLRSAGAARMAMQVTLGAAVVTAVLDPLLIFWAGLGYDGAAITVIVSRSVMAVVGLWGAKSQQSLLGRFDTRQLAADARALAAVAGPAVLTNLATPVGAAFITHSMAPFGADAVAGQATIDRLTPVAFALIYALSGAVGPIVGQNMGARQFDRVRRCLVESLKFMGIAVLVAWAALAISQGWLISAFSLHGQAAELVRAFCQWLAATFLFLGALFVANAAFNNLGKPLWSTGFNWARATLGTIPLAWWGSRYGPIGVLAGQALGAMIFGSLAMVAAFKLAKGLGRE